MVERSCDVASCGLKRLGSALALSGLVSLIAVGVAPAAAATASTATASSTAIASATIDDSSAAPADGSACPNNASAVGTPGAMPRDLTAENASQAQSMATVTGNPVEDLSQRTESSQVFANPDGTWTLSDYLGDNWVLTAGDGSSIGDWSDIDLTLEIADDGLVRPKAHTNDIALAPGGAKTDVIITSVVRDSGVVLKVLWDGKKLPQVELDGARATYPDVWPGVDYVVDVTMAGFEQYFVLKTRAAGIARAKDLVLPIEVTGGSVVEDETGAFQVVDDTGSIVAIVPVAMAWDALDDDTQLSPVLQPWSADPHLSKGRGLPGMPTNVNDLFENATTGMVEPQGREVAMSVVPEGRGVNLKVEVDEAWLADAATAYPVIVDPTYAVHGTNATYDTYVRSAAPTSNYGTYTETRIGSTDGGATKSRSYFTFNTSTIKDKDVLAAYFHLWNYWSATCSQYGWYAYWTAPAGSSTTWYNYPAYRSSSYAYSTDTEGHTSSTTPWCPQDWATIDISQFALEWVHRPEDTQGIYLTTSFASIAYWKRFYSLEHSSGLKPHINYVYNRTPNAPSASSIKVDDLALTENRVSTVARPVVSAVVSDPDGDQVQAYFTITQNGVVLVDALAGTKVSSGGTSTATLPYGLASNVDYEITVWVEDARLSGDSTTPAFTFTGPTTGGPADLPADDDDETGVAS